MSGQTNPASGSDQHGRNETLLFWACFFSIVATAFGFIIRAQIIGDLQADFKLDETQKGQILGVGLWPFAISIVLFSLVIDKIGYGTAMIFAFVCHVLSAILTMTATSYNALWVGTFICALGNGTVEAVANPVVATLFPREKTKWLNILHAGWPGGLVLGGIFGIVMQKFEWDWTYLVGLILLPTALYGVLMLGRKFPIHERVAAGVSYLDMLKEGGVVAAFIVVALMVREIGTNVIHIGGVAQIAVIAVIVGAYGAYVRSFGRPMFIFLVLVMIPLATTELGTDSWITDLMGPEMGNNAGWVLIYTSFIMMVLRFFAGSIVHRISPLGLLCVSAALAAAGLFALSVSSGIMILVAATVFAFGKTFFWPTTLGVVAEQFPRGGALTMNMIAGVGMLGVGIVGSVFLGYTQDNTIDKALKKENATLHAQIMNAEPKESVFGSYSAIDQAKLSALGEAEQKEVQVIQGNAKKSALATVAILPCIMLLCYIVLLLYFRSIGGYKVQEIGGADGGH